MTIYRTKKGIILAIAQQLPSSVYEGPSITNSAEYLWSAFAHEVNIPSINMIMIEKYIHDDGQETYDIVTNILNSVSWKRVSNTTIRNILESSTEVTAQEARDGHGKRSRKDKYLQWRGSKKLDSFIQSYGGY